MGDFPGKVLKTNIDIYLKDLTSLISVCIEKRIFPDELKFVDVSPVFKEGESLDQENYRPRS